MACRGSGDQDNMNILEKIKLFGWAWRMIKVLEKMKLLVGKLDGIKSGLGLVGVLGYYAAQAYGLNPPEAVLTTSFGLLGVGLVHKLEKATGIIKIILPVLGSVIATLDKKKEEKK